MKYIVLSDDGKEYGPVDADTLRKWVETGRVLPHTQVRNVMMKRWNRASDLDFLKEAFEKQIQKIEQHKSILEHGIDFLKSLFGAKKVNIDKSTAFKYEYLPDPAPISLRIMAFLFDLFIIASIAFILFLIFVILMKAGYNVNSLFLVLFLIFYASILLYFGLTLGLFAQTPGMWFWGIMIVTTETGEVLLGRAYFHTLMMLLFGIISPLIVYLNPHKRSLHEILAGTKIIRIAAKPKA